ncbi:MAG: hypothetical protein M3Z35_14385 [Nitrospirota bacterium]|nr:hypothetical protein [Nitrospirota bacterium]
MWAQPKEPAQEIPLQVATLERLMGLLQEREAEILTLKGLFGAQIQGPGIPGTQRVEGAIVYHRPDALRLRGFNRLGMRLFELTVGEDRYTLRLINGKVLTGNMTDLNRVEKIARPFRLSALAMTGIIGTPSVAMNERAELKEEGERYRLDVFASGNGMNSSDSAYRRIWFDRRSLHVVQEDRLTPIGEIEASVHFDDFRPVNLSPDNSAVQTGTLTVKTVLKPFVIRAEDSQGPSSIQLTFHEIAPNMPLTPEELQLTDGIQIDAQTGNGMMG